MKTLFASHTASDQIKLEVGGRPWNEAAKLRMLVLF